MRSLMEHQATIRGGLVIAGGVLLFVAGLMLSDSLVEILLTSAVALGMLGFGIMSIRDSQAYRSHADIALWLVAISVVFLLS